MAKSTNIKGISFGGALLVTIFAVMVLAIFGSLSLVAALADLRLSQKHTDFVTAYYAADSIAQGFLAELDQGLKGNTNELSRELLNKNRLTKTFIINNEQSLVVTVVIDNNNYRITEYKTISTVDADYTTFFNLFDGEFK